MLVGVLVVSATVPLSGLGLRPAAAQGGLAMSGKPGVVSILVIPFEDKTNVTQGPGRADFVTSVTNAVLRAMKEAKGDDKQALFDAYVFSPNMVSVRRAIQEGRLTPAVVEGEKDPYAAIQIAAALGYEAVLTGKISEYKYRERPAEVSITLEGTAYDVAGNYDTQAGVKEHPAPAVNFAVTGLSQPRPHAREVEQELHRQAVNNAAFKLISSLAGKRTSPPHKPSGKTKWLKWGVIGIVLLAIGVAVANNKEQGQPLYNGPLPPTNLQIDRDQTSLRLAWTEPPNQTGLILFGYHLQRQSGGGPFVFIGDEVLPAGTRSYNDFQVISGERYTYCIRAVYTSGQTSDWVIFYSVVAQEGGRR
jgi:hypothetical protein